MLQGISFSQIVKSPIYYEIFYPSKWSISLGFNEFPGVPTTLTNGVSKHWTDELF